MEQLSFLSPELDLKRTQEAVETALEKYRLYKLTDFEPREAAITPGYNERFHGNTNVTSDQTASVGIYNVDAPNMQRQYCERLERVVRRLSHKERTIIEERYMKDDYVRDIEVYARIMPMDIKTYMKYRRSAFYKLAFALEITVTKGRE
jgi:ArpU family phage transcriptional regulator